MSIYAGWLDIDDDGHEVGCAVYERMPDGQGWDNGAAMVTGDAFYRRVGKPCTCGNRAPIVYQGSHVNPAGDDPRGGSVDIAAIPNFLHPNVRRQRFENPDADEDMRFPVEFLRLSVREDSTTYRGGHPGYAQVVLDRGQVERVRDTLTRWLETEERW